ncbi:hypothetical protein BDV95DRAFT_600202 [Massariosphaeria phaeospora]|uniref:Uncharacterized protein n=1 Tax=Massariosphaeria phaeospora TaxID=100035 RepID=A0A7C8HYC8_9PLEO|nr:hypothetical protein BDV95DRAFT_600202 [Massariosphaeria phaeospora]
MDPQWKAKYKDEIRQYGPLPAGFIVREAPEQKGVPEYGVQPKGNTDFISATEHPLSTPGSITFKAVMTKPDAELRIDPPVMDPPIIYMPASWKWTYEADCVQAVAQSLINDGVKTTASQVFAAWQSAQNTEDKNKDQDKDEEMDTLYHPSDRGVLSVFDQEGQAARLARVFGRGLIIIAPEVKKRADWDSVYQYLPSKRPIVRSRWSVGLQEDLRPIIMGCIPTHRFPDNVAQGPRWYIMTPSPDMKQYLASKPDPNLYQRLGFSDQKQLEWAIFALHRSITLGSVPSLNDGLTRQWLQQYAAYLRSGKYGTKGFAFDPKKPAEGVDGTFINFTAISIWILWADAGSNLRTYADQWDAAVVARLNTRNNLNQTTWAEFPAAVTAMQFKK